MKGHSIVRNSKNALFDCIATSFVAMLFVFVVEVCLNLTSFFGASPDSAVSALFYSAKLSGYDWSALLNDKLPEFSFLSALIYRIPFMLCQNNPLAIWQVAAGIMALIRSLIAFVSTYISSKYFRFDCRIAIFIGLFCTFIVSNRPTTLSAFPIVILLVWILFLCVLCYETSKNKHIRFICVISSSLAVVLSMAVDKRYFVFIFALITFFAYKGFRKRRWNDFVTSAVSLCVFCLSEFILESKIVSVLLENENLYQIEGTYQSYFSKFLVMVPKLFSLRGIKVFFDYIACRILEVSVSTWAIALFAIICTVILFFSKYKTDNVIPEASALIVLCFFLTLVFEGIYLINLLGCAERDHIAIPEFFSSYSIAFVVGPMTIVGLYCIVGKKRETGKFIKPTELALAFLFLYSFLSVIIPAISEGNTIFGKFFLSSASVLLILGTAYSLVTTIAFGLFSLIIVLVVFYIFGKQDNTKRIALFVALIVLFRYVGTWIVYEKQDELLLPGYKILHELVDSDVIVEESEIYINADKNTVATNQLMFPQLKLQSGVPDDDVENYILISSTSLKNVNNPDNVRFLQWDDEFIYIGGEETINAFEEAGYMLKNSYDETYISALVWKLYNVVLGREADREGLLYWIEAVSESPSAIPDVVYTFISTEEYADLDKNYMQTIDELVYLFDYTGVENRDNFSLSYQQKKELAYALGNGMTMQELINKLYSLSYASRIESGVNQ